MTPPKALYIFIYICTFMYLRIYMSLKEDVVTDTPGYRKKKEKGNERKTKVKVRV